MSKFHSLLLLCLSTLPLAAAAVFHVNPPRLPDGAVGKIYTGGPLVLQGGGQCPRNIPAVRVVAGSLPAGMYLFPAGQFGGGPLESGRFEFVVRVENGCGWSDQSMAIEVAGTPVFFANPAALEFRVAPGQGVAPTSLQVSSNVPGQTYSVESSVAWVRARARAGRTPASGSALVTDLVDVEFDTSSLGPGMHRGSIDIGGWRMSPVSVPVRVEVLGAGPAAFQYGAGAEGDLRLPSISIGPTATATPARGEAPQVPSLDAHGAPKPAASRPAAVPGRLSRSAQLRSKYLAAKPAPAHPPAASAAAEPHAKPSPVGEPVKKADHAPDAHAKPAAAAPPAAKAPDAHAKPAPDAHAKPAADAHGKPADAHAKPKEAAKH